MAGFPRYAIYYASARGSPLDRFGAQLLGYDAWTGEELPFPDAVVQTAPDWRKLTTDPRKYGFHATLKAPFALAQRKTEAALLFDCRQFAMAGRRIPVIRPRVDSISGFIAIIPAERSGELDLLAKDCVSAFDHFRVELSEQERARRNPEELTPRQLNYLDRWGYPYVMEEYRFHMTLTGRLDQTRRPPVQRMLHERFSATGIENIEIDRISLFRQDDVDARFRVIGDWPLCAA